MDIVHDLVGFPHLVIERAEVQETEIPLYVKLRTESAIGPQCHQEYRDRPQNAVRVIRDLALSGSACYRHVRRRRFWWARGGLSVAESLEFVEPHRNDTIRDEAHMDQLVRQTTITDVEAVEGLRYEVGERIFFREATRRIPADPVAELWRLGLDEIAERKGRNAYDLILPNLDTGKPVDVLKGRTKQQLVAYLTAFAETVNGGVAEVCIDRWRPDAEAVYAVFPQATVVVDRFHGMRSVTSDRQALKNARKNDLPEEAKTCHYPLLKNQADLTESQQETLDAVYEADPVLKRAHQLKEQLRAIFDTMHTVDDARKQIQRWIRKADKHGLFPTVITHMKTWLSDRLNYFQHRTTNSPSDGIKNKIKLGKRRAYGFRNFQHFRLRILTTF
jgi:transposase